MTNLTSHGQSEKASIRMTGGPEKIFFAGKNFFGKLLALFLSITIPKRRIDWSSGWRRGKPGRAFFSGKEFEPFQIVPSHKPSIDPLANFSLSSPCATCDFCRADARNRSADDRAL